MLQTACGFFNNREMQLKKSSKRIKFSERKDMMHEMNLGSATDDITLLSNVIGQELLSGENEAIVLREIKNEQAGNGQSRRYI